jgi:hypothetical protein
MTTDTDVSCETHLIIGTDFWWNSRVERQACNFADRNKARGSSQSRIIVLILILVLLSRVSGVAAYFDAALDCLKPIVLWMKCLVAGC